LILFAENCLTLFAGSQQANYSTDCDCRSKRDLFSRIWWQYLYPFIMAVND